MIMEGGNKDMEANEKSIRMKSDQFMKDKNEHDFKQVTN